MLTHSTPPRRKPISRRRIQWPPDRAQAVSAFICWDGRINLSEKQAVTDQQTSGLSDSTAHSFLLHLGLIMLA